MIICIYSCPATAFRCADGACIDGNLRCNGIDNCADGSDESRSSCTEWPTSLPTFPQPITSTPPSPSLRNCRAPPQPKNGHWKLHQSQCLNRLSCNVSEGTELELGSYLIYSCNPGYKINGFTDAFCNFEGKVINIPVCSGIKKNNYKCLRHLFEKKYIYF